ncbi:MAG: helix-turn-helix transcriptional regulator [Chloroflexi bacterium]|nr:helix-turn-helix transcriptional regulator [Chloroflexota bacterium]
MPRRGAGIAVVDPRVGRAFRVLRTFYGRRAQEVAAEAGLHVGQVNHFEAGRRPVSELEALRLLRAIVPTIREEPQHVA